MTKKVRIKRICPACDGRGKSYGYRYCGCCKGRHKVTETITISDDTRTRPSSEVEQIAAELSAELRGAFYDELSKAINDD